MNPLKEHPNLFANGKFKVDTVGGIQKIQGYKNNFHCQDDIYEEHVLMLSDGDLRAPEQCTLIARPIADMTDEELRNYPNGGESPHALDNKAWIEQDLRSGLMPKDRFLYLLSIGVYPFDQSHFEDGTVINEAEIRNKMG